MKPFNEIEEMIKESRVMASSATDERILGALPNEASESPDDAPAADTGRRRHLNLMRALTVAAVLIFGLGLLAVLFPYHNGLLSENLAWADIQQAIAEQNGVFITGTRRCIFPARDTEPEQVYTYRTEKWASNAGYIDSTLELDGTPVMLLCYHFESGTVTIVYHFAHQYYHFQVPEAYRTQLQGVTPLGLIERLFQTGAEPLPPQWRQGRRAQGFAIDDMDRRLDENLSPAWIRYFFFHLTQSEAEIWIDLDTKLPLYMEGNFVLDKCLFSDFITMHWEEVSDNWQWGVPVDNNAFFPTMPEGFLSMTLPNPETTTE